MQPDGANQLEEMADSIPPRMMAKEALKSSSKLTAHSFLQRTNSRIENNIWCHTSEAAAFEPVRRQRPLQPLHSVWVWLIPLMVNLPLPILPHPAASPLEPQGICTLQALCQDACEMRWNTQMLDPSRGHPGSQQCGTFHCSKQMRRKWKSARQRLCYPISKLSFIYFILFYF